MKTKSAILVMGLTLLVSCNDTKTQASESRQKHSFETLSKMSAAVNSIDTKSPLKKRAAQKKNHQLHQADHRAKEVMKFVKSLENVCVDIGDVALEPNLEVVKVNDSKLFGLVEVIDGMQSQMASAAKANPDKKVTSKDRNDFTSMCSMVKKLVNVKAYNKEMKKYGM